MAQIIELLGDFPLDVKMGGKYSRELFDHTGKSLLLLSGCTCFTILDLQVPFDILRH